MPAQTEPSPNGVKQETPVTSSRLALLLSATLCPGAGHFAQGRYIQGVVYLAVFVTALVMMLFAVLVPLMTNLRIIMDFAEKGGSEPFRTVSLGKVLGWFGLAVLAYLTALIDIVAYNRRKARKKLDESRKNLESA